MNSLSCLTNALHCKKKVAMSFMSLGKKTLENKVFIQFGFPLKFSLYLD